MYMSTCARPPHCNNLLNALSLVMMLTDIDIDMVTGEALNTISIFAIAEDGSLLAAAKVNSMDTLNARYWHEPKNEREFIRSPQRALWQTAKELKWDQYLQLNMFEWVLLNSVDRKVAAHWLCSARLAR